MNTMTLTNNKLNSLTEEEMKVIQRLSLIDDLKAEYKKSEKEASFDLEFHIHTWLEDANSRNTKRMYKVAIERFLKHINNDIFSVDTRIADEYIRTLKKETACGNTTALYVNAVASFYTYLTRYSFVTRNPFSGSKVKIDRKPMKDAVVPTQSDIQALHKAFSELKSTSARLKMEIATRLMCKYGIRKGFLDNMELHSNRLHSISKNKEYVITLSEADAKFIAENVDILPQLNSGTMSNNFKTAVNILFEKGLLSSKINPHSLRHYYAMSFYEKSGHDIYRLKEKLNHSSIAITENYLRGLKVI